MKKTKKTNKTLVDPTSKPLSLSLQEFKSAFYHLNAKPDSEIKILQEEKLISLQDIIELNQQIQHKLYTHTVTVLMTTVNVSLTDDRTLEFSLWPQFEAHRWTHSACVRSVGLKWDFFLQLPHFQNPQRHTLHVRLGTQVKPAEMFQVIFAGEDDHQFEEASANVVCKVDFINEVISKELIGIVTEWHKSLQDPSTKQPLVRFIEKYRRPIYMIPNFFFPSLTILSAMKLAEMNLQYLMMDSIANFIFYGGIFLITLLLSYLIGELVSFDIVKRIRKLKSSTIFSITRGDNNRNNVVNRDNLKLISQIGVELGFSLISNIIASIIHLL